MAHGIRNCFVKMTKTRGGSATPSISTSNPYEPLNFNYDLEPPSKNKRPRSEFTTHNTGKFLIVSHADPEQNLNKVNPFVVMKALESYTTELKDINKLRNGTLLIETRNERQTNILLNATTLEQTPIKVKEHPTLNTVRGTVYSYDLLDMDEEYILENLKNQNVSKVERVKKFNASRELVPTPLLILTFENKILPISIKAGYLFLRVRMYYPMPLKCKTCHKFGHTAKRCRGEKLCVSCGEPSHEGECTEIKCLNCTRFYPMYNTNPHRANDRNCLKFLEEKEIVKIMVEENKMYNDARIKFNQKYPKTSTSSTFAATVKNNSTTNNLYNNSKKYKTTTVIDPTNNITSKNPIKENIQTTHTAKTATTSNIRNACMDSASNSNITINQKLPVQTQAQRIENYENNKSEEENYDMITDEGLSFNDPPFDNNQ